MRLRCLHCFVRTGCCDGAASPLWPRLPTEVSAAPAGVCPVSRRGAAGGSAHAATGAPALERGPGGGQGSGWPPGAAAWAGPGAWRAGPEACGGGCCGWGQFVGAVSCAASGRAAVQMHGWLLMPLSVLGTFDSLPVQSQGRRTMLDAPCIPQSMSELQVSLSIWLLQAVLPPFSAHVSLLVSGDRSVPDQPSNISLKAQAALLSTCIWQYPQWKSYLWKDYLKSHMHQPAAEPSLVPMSRKLTLEEYWQPTFHNAAADPHSDMTLVFSRHAAGYRAWCQHRPCGLPESSMSAAHTAPQQWSERDPKSCASHPAAVRHHRIWVGVCRSGTECCSGTHLACPQHPVLILGTVNSASHVSAGS